MTERERQSKFAKMVALLILFAYEMGYEISFGDAWARTGHKKGSYHYRRLAIDLNLFRGSRYLSDWEDHKPLGEFWESIGGTWGGRWDMNVKQEGHQGDGNHYSFGEE